MPDFMREYCPEYCPRLPVMIMSEPEYPVVMHIGPNTRLNHPSKDIGTAEDAVHVCVVGHDDDRGPRGGGIRLLGLMPVQSDVGGGVNLSNSVAGKHQLASVHPSAKIDRHVQNELRLRCATH